MGGEGGGEWGEMDSLVRMLTMPGKLFCTLVNHRLMDEHNASVDNNCRYIIMKRVTDGSRHPSPKHEKRKHSGGLHIWDFLSLTCATSELGGLSIHDNEQRRVILYTLTRA